MKRGTDRKLKFLMLKNRLKLPNYQVKGILQAIWDFTFDNAPRGDIGRFTNEQICAAIEYKGDAGKLIYALQIEHWLDPHPIHRFVIHDWKEHADEYLKMLLKKQGFAQDDKTIIQDEIPVNPKADENKIPPPTPDLLQALWNNERLDDWPKCQTMDGKRRVAARIRLKEIPDLDRWLFLIGALKRDRWYERFHETWRPNIDWLLRPGKAMERIEIAERHEAKPKVDVCSQAVNELLSELVCQTCGAHDLEENSVIHVTLGENKGYFCERCLGESACK